MTPEVFLAEVVMPTAREFLEAPGERRLAYLACISAFHLCDYLHRANGISLKSIREEIRGRCHASFDVVEGICNGSKHCGRDHTKAVFRHIPGTEQDIRPFGFGEGCGGFGEGRFGGPAGLAVAHDGQQFLVDLCLLDFLHAAADAFPTHVAVSTKKSPA